MDLAIHILEGVLLVGLAGTLVITYLISEDLRKIAMHLADRLEELEREARQKEKYREELKASNERAIETLKHSLESMVAKRNSINVTDSPLDFPPTKKED